MVAPGAEAAPAGRAAHDLRLVPAAVVVWGSALGGLLLGWRVGVACAGAGVVAGAAALWRLRRDGPRHHRTDRERSRGLAAAGALVLCAALAAGPLGVRIATAQQDPLRAEAERGGEAGLRVTLAERPRPLRSAGYAGQAGGVRSVLVPVEVRAATVRGRDVPTAARALLIAPYADWARLLPGQTVTAHGSLAPARSGELIAAVAYVRGPPRDPTRAPWWQRAAESVRAALRAACAVLPDEPAGLLPGLVLGDTSALPPRVEQEFLDAGLSHLTAVSGANIAIVCGSVLLLLRAVRCGPRCAAAAAGLVLAGFLVLVGPEPSVLRAGVMGAVALGALVLGRNRSVLPALAAAVCALVLHDPAMAVSHGFALSVAATAGLVLLAPRWAGALTRRRVPAGVAEGLAVPLAAFLVTAPIVAGMAGSVSVVSVAANVLAAPVVAPVTVLGVLAAGAAVACPPVAEVLVRVAEPGVRWLIVVAREASAVPGAVLPWPSGWWGGLLAVGAVALLVLALRYRPARLLLALALVAAVVVAIPVRVVAPSWPPPGWALVACEVGQGDGLVLATGEPGRAVVVDAGPEPGPIDRCLDRLGVDRVPLVVLSHLHADHIGGLPSVFEGRAVGAIGVGPGRVPDWAWRRVVADAGAHGVPLVELGAGLRLGWPALRLDVLGPGYVPPPDGEPEGTEVNNASVVLRADTPAGSVLLTGDVELAAQADLLASGADLRAEILKVPHHGSRFLVPRFVDAVAPRIAVVSVGRGNTYGHPNGVALRMLTGAGALVARTDTGGDTAVVPGERDPAVVRRGPSARADGRRARGPPRPARPPGAVSRRGPRARRPRTAAPWPWGRSGPPARRASSGRRR
ncbi:ComEC/Rec2 family competence protein [Prauserella shujinwangii]|uniref:ComEC/Rec2 family competence protein n=1 Tax=Prauserella shujinwangii TaxID=1453103 RepID=UPI001FE70A38|nr:ComEC/Rec2 family competence protein [Prauserella shujinwangii]